MFFDKYVNCVVIIGNVRKIKTKTGDDMGFISGSDETGTCDFIVFPKNNTLINEITSLKLDNYQIEDLTGIEKFVGLTNELDISFNYVDTLEKVFALVDEKLIEEEILNKVIDLKLKHNTKLFALVDTYATLCFPMPAALTNICCFILFIGLLYILSNESFSLISL